MKSPAWRAALLITTVFLPLFTAVVVTQSAGESPAKTDYQPVIGRLEQAIAFEMQTKKLPALSIALVDDQEVVWATGFGFADRQKQRRATADTVYRVGSVSKLYTDLAIMELVEQGKIDLDAPLATYLPDVQVKNPFDRPITLRQLMSHRSGLVRESPVGNYFDPDEPTLEASVLSLNGTELVYEPEQRSKYSNAGIAAVGLVLERVQQKPFNECLQRMVLEPLGLDRSSFALTDDIRPHVADALMWTYDGREYPAPEFKLGTAPAGNLYSTARDQAMFLRALFAHGRGARGQLVKPETLIAMFEPQFAAEGQTDGYGLGFAVRQFEGRRRVGHGGAVYGFATEVAGLPDDKLGVVVVTNVDVANAVVRRISDYALRWMIAAREGKPLDPYPTSEPLDAARAAQLAGSYLDGEQRVDIVARGNRLIVPVGDYIDEVRQDSQGLVVDGRINVGTRVATPDDDTLVIGTRTLRRTDNPLPGDIPDHWRGLIGEYGWDHNTLYIFEHHGQLWSLIEWFFFYPLREISEDVYAFPTSGLYDGERLIFRRDAEGRATEVEAASVLFARRAVSDLDNTSLRIRPMRELDELRRESLAATPPKEQGQFRESDLVELTKLDPTIRLDIRYASTNNFLGTPLYEQPRAFVQRPAAEALVRAHQKLKPHGYGLLVYDGYRPWYVTRMFWEATPPDQRLFVADPSRGSRHNRGCAVDLTLFDLATGEPVRTTGEYDEFSPRSFPDYPGGTSRQRWHRELLRRAMEAEGFTVFEFEWWHFDYNDWRSYPLGNAPFERLSD